MSPRIRRYVAVDEVCRERLVAEHAVAPDRVEVLLNFVDLARFRPRGPLPPRPRRALVFATARARPRSFRSCARPARGSASTSRWRVGVGTRARPARGRSFPGSTWSSPRAGRPSRPLPSAPPSWCATRRTGPDGHDGRARATACPELGVRLLRRRLEPSAVVEEIARYDAGGCGRRLRPGTRRGGSRGCPRPDRAIYRRALATPPFGDPSPAAESRSASRYLLFLAPTLKQAWGVAQERDRPAGGGRGARLGDLPDARGRSPGGRATSSFDRGW